MYIYFYCDTNTFLTFEKDIHSYDSRVVVILITPPDYKTSNILQIA